MPDEHFDLAVVGGGKGGKTLATQFARAGQRVAMIERGMIGGSCINVACIPTKTMVRSALVADLARRADTFGVRVGEVRVDPVGVRQRKRDVVAGMVRRNQEAFDASGMTLLIGEARFTGPLTLEVRLRDGSNPRSVSADRVVINTGTRPSLPDVPGLAEAKVLTSETIQELDRVPEHLIVLGGGYIGCEFAQMFRRFGSRVTLVDRGPRLLPREDADMADAIAGIFREDGIEIVSSATLPHIEGVSGQSVRLRVQLPTGERAIEASDVLVAAGRVPNTEGLDLSAAGVGIDAKGFVRVNEFLETTAVNVYAVGDVNGGPQFTHVSLDDARIVRANLGGARRTTEGRQVPSVLFIDPEFGRVGMTEAEARQKGYPVRIARMPAGAVPRAVTMGETRGLWKAVVSRENERILGVAILGAEGGEVMSVAQVAMRAGLPFHALRDQMFAHPTLAEGLNDLLGRLEG